jgi:hypothetical protein
MSIATKLGQEITAKAGKRLSQKAADRASKEVVEKAAKKTVGDVIVRGTAKAAETANPLLDATLSAIQAEIKEKGAFSAHVIDELQLAVTQTNTAEEARRVVELAKKLSFKNAENKGAMISGLQRAIEKSAVTDEALATLKAVVKTRQDCYALFTLGEKHTLTFNAVDKLMRSGDEKTVTEMAIHVIPKPVFGPKPPHFNWGDNELKKTLEEKIDAVARYLNSALR